MVKNIPSLFVRDKIWFFVLYFLAFLLLIGLVVFSVNFDVHFSNLTRDPSSISGTPPYYGFLSNLGIIIWSFSVAINFFTYSIIKKRKSMIRDKRLFILYSGFLGLLLLVDDMFLLHETVFPVYFSLNEKIVLVLYAVAMLYFLIRFKTVILKQTNYIFLGLFLCFLGTSVLIDILPEFSERWHYLLEDGPKFLGIVSWLGYQFLASREFITTKAS